MSNPRQRKQRLQGAFGRGVAGPATKPDEHSTTVSTTTSTKTEGSLSSRFPGQQTGLGFQGQALKFEDQNLDKRQPTSYEIIEDEGEHVISKEPSGEAKLVYYPNFLKEAEALEIYRQLIIDLPWTQKINKKADFEYVEPRMTVWYGDIKYKYSGVTQEPTTAWHPVLQELRKKIHEKTGLKFNSMLGNWYRDGHDGVGWHSDNEYSLGKNPAIASLSFGETRAFQLRKNPENPCDDYEFTDKKQINLMNGSLLLMLGAVQDDWQHRVPREYHEREGRINLTFRTIYPK